METSGVGQDRLMYDSRRYTGIFRTSRRIFNELKHLMRQKMP